MNNHRTFARWHHTLPIPRVNSVFAIGRLSKAASDRRHRRAGVWETKARREPPISRQQAEYDRYCSTSESGRAGERTIRPRPFQKRRSPVSSPPLRSVQDAALRHGLTSRQSLGISKAPKDVAPYVELCRDHFHRTRQSREAIRRPREGSQRTCR